jgi:alkanesulfonate monooxygenase SsuD/methylene tetrahydromethanopterin reductase-like flavin-dependent oxidoreductase (luciferase family)
MPSSSFPIQFGWVLPPGAKAGDIARGGELDSSRPGYLGSGPQARDARARFDAGVRRALNTISGHWDSAWTTDHFQWGDDDCLEALTELAFYAALTPQLKWGTMVLGQGYRNPALLAKMASTIQYLTHGNLILGIGAGWKQDEFLAYGYGFPSAGTRIAQLEDAVSIIRRMWTQPKSDYSGTYYRVDGAINLPQTPQPPRLLIGGGGEHKMLPLVARHADWWNVTAYADDYARKVDILKRECDAIGRDFSTLRLTWFGGVGIGRDEAEVQRRVRDSFCRDRGLWGTPDQIAALMQSLIDVGCSYFMFDTRAIPEPGELELLIDVSRRFA